MEKIKNIEFLRTFLIMVVISLHVVSSGSFSLYRYFSNDILKNIHSFLLQANNSVEGFFIISGFLLFLTFKPQKLSDYIKRKYIRLVPVIIFAILICWVLGMFNAFEVKFWGDILTIFLFNNIGICFAQGSLPVLWYTSALFGAMLIYFLILAKKSEKTKVLCFSCVPIIAYLILEFLQYGNFSSPHKNYYFVFNVGFLRALGGVGFGCMVGYLYKFYKDKLNLNVLLASCLEMVLACYIIWWLVFPHTVQNCIIFVFCFGILLFLFALKQGCISRFFEKEIWEKLGRYQYSLYVTHSVIGKALCLNFWSNHLDFVKNYTIEVITLTILLILISGVLAYHMVELPCSKYLKEKYIK